MRIQTVSAEFGDQPRSSSTIDIKLDVSALLEATDESDHEWTLEMNIAGFGTQYVSIAGKPCPLPTAKTYRDVVGGTQRPRGMNIGDIWNTHWEHTLQKNKFTVPDKDIYHVQVRLIPALGVNPSPWVTHTVIEDID